MGDWSLRQVSVAGGDDRDVILSRIDLTIKAGDITLITGQNGAGKSTLLEALAGLRPLADGSIALNGKMLWQEGKWRKRLERDVIMSLGIALQHSEAQWFASTVKEELFYSLRPYKLQRMEEEQRIADAMLQLGLSMELMSRDPWSLSGGQQRRLSLACLLACRTEWLLLDEPTAGLDADGIDRLCGLLAAHREAGKSAVVVTHDLEALLPLADSVVIVADGKVRQAAPADIAGNLASAWIPQAWRTEALLREAELLPPSRDLSWSGSSAVQSLSSAELAESLAPMLMERKTGFETGADGRDAGASTVEADTVLEKGSVSYAVKQNNGTMRSTEDVRSTEEASDRKPMWLRPDTFDPRALLIANMMLVAGVLMANELPNLFFAAGVVILSVMPLWRLIASWNGIIRGFFVFIVTLTFIAGLSLQPLGFSWKDAEPAFIRLGGMLLMMVLGMPLLKLMTPLRLQRAIEQTFGWLSRFRVPVHTFALLVTLIFRFIPLLIGEWGRFAKLAHARGKATTTVGSIPLRMLRSVMLPFLRSILRLAEEMADAMEARGYGHVKTAPAYGFRLVPGCWDALIVAIALLGLSVMYITSQLL
ncbi:ATP-binding cassette domain-containing protein [Paenibacillus sp. J5C_2022]|uniref:ATP-binding cassette domain-containing protein n=1 Tax=Paenibacillus sp. J5C2022 TaxID=2977129 RepID=UPI0021D16133|nr:ATP-binding cassette domain-containing protein [Paenibacillus sp. J5C2022]MCU6707188.1 ATP-binding cassette domain-containing protein [Paenibacillus sp. J5C2022]